MSDTRELREALEQAQARVKQLEKARSGPAQGVELQRKLTRTEAALAQSEADVKELRRLQASLGDDRLARAEAALSEATAEVRALKRQQAAAVANETAALTRKLKRVEAALVEARARHEVEPPMVPPVLKHAPPAPARATKRGEDARVEALTRELEAARSQYAAGKQQWLAAKEENAQLRATVRALEATPGAAAPSADAKKALRALEKERDAARAQVKVLQARLESVDLLIKDASRR